MDTARQNGNKPDILSSSVFREVQKDLERLLLGNGFNTVMFHPHALNALADRIMEQMQKSYPDMQIPPKSCWRALEGQNVDRFGVLASAQGFATETDFFRSASDLAILCALADIRLPADWTFLDPMSGARLEGVSAKSVATAVMFGSGVFSSDPSAPMRADAYALSRVTADEVSAGFQFENGQGANAANALARQFRRLGELIAIRTDLFEDSDGIRPGNIANKLRSELVSPNIDAGVLLDAVFDGLTAIWDGGAVEKDRILGDVWASSLENTNEGADLWSFHLPAGAVCLNLIEPFGWTGFGMISLDVLPAPSDTGHAALFKESGLLSRTEGADPTLAACELRAATMAASKLVASSVRQKLEVGSDTLPMACLIEAGTQPMCRKLRLEKPQLWSDLDKMMDPRGVHWLPFGA